MPDNIAKHIKKLYYSVKEVPAIISEVALRKSKNWNLNLVSPLNLIASSETHGQINTSTSYNNKHQIKGILIEEKVSFLKTIQIKKRNKLKEM